MFLLQIRYGNNANRKGIRVMMLAARTINVRRREVHIVVWEGAEGGSTMEDGQEGGEKSWFSDGVS